MLYFTSFDIVRSASCQFRAINWVSTVIWEWKVLVTSRWLVTEFDATLTNQMQSLNRSNLGHPRFPALHEVCLFYFEFESTSSDWIFLLVLTGRCVNFVGCVTTINREALFENRASIPSDHLRIAYRNFPFFLLRNPINLRFVSAAFITPWLIYQQLFVCLFVFQFTSPI